MCRTVQKHRASMQRQRLDCCSFDALLGCETLLSQTPLHEQPTAKTSSERKRCRPEPANSQSGERD
ncbi:hypothetical protein J6590_089156 [Homalodisca vitripennis]|nr:hypothetical protein J6590_089740 [Homalodisca vitripennis]KAG8275302.1 hypothetical protein J6590_089156 [Homalodisca vitripennis]